MSDADASIKRTSFELNKAINFGGAIYARNDCSVHMEKGCSFENNQAGDSGGAIYVDQTSTIRLSKTKFIGNIASSNQCNNIFYDHDEPDCGP
jgi:predicted outer membrane repeat protein